MALPSAAPERQLKHRRSIEVNIYARGNGLWEVDAEISDIKTHATPLAGGLRPAGEPIHDMLLRVVVDERFNVVEAGSQTRAMPYPGHCDDLNDVYRRLVGLNLLKGFRRDVNQRLGGVIDTREDSASDSEPPQIDRCHALRRDGPVVQMFYPRWHRTVVPATSAPPVSET
jgi:hypothetical protein